MDLLKFPAILPFCFVADFPTDTRRLIQALVYNLDPHRHEASPRAEFANDLRAESTGLRRLLHKRNFLPNRLGFETFAE